MKNICLHFRVFSPFFLNCSEFYEIMVSFQVIPSVVLKSYSSCPPVSLHILSLETYLLMMLSEYILTWIFATGSMLLVNWTSWKIASVNAGQGKGPRKKSTSVCIWSPHWYYLFSYIWVIIVYMLLMHMTVSVLQRFFHWSNMTFCLSDWTYPFLCREIHGW